MLAEFWDAILDKRVKVPTLVPSHSDRHPAQLYAMALAASTTIPGHPKRFPLSRAF